MYPSQNENVIFQKSQIDQVVLFFFTKKIKFYGEARMLFIDLPYLIKGGNSI